MSRAPLNASLDGTMGPEVFIEPSQIGAVPLLLLFVLLVVRRESRTYALSVLIPSLLVGIAAAIEGPNEHRLTFFAMGFCLSSVILGFLAFIISLVIHAIKYPDGGGETS